MLTPRSRAVSKQLFPEKLRRPHIMRRPIPNGFSTKDGQLGTFLATIAGYLSGLPGRLASHMNIALFAIIFIIFARLLFVGG